MPDVVDSATRSRMMAGIRGKNTKPELLIRRSLHKAGFRFRLHGEFLNGRLPGKPDLVFSGRRAVLFIHGCFWHGHNCHLFRPPGTRPEFWQVKIASNVGRDLRDINALHDQNWRVGTVWECALRGRKRLPFSDVMNRIGNWLESGQNDLTIRGVTEDAEDKKGTVTGPVA